MKTILLIFVPLIMFSQSYETQKYKLINKTDNFEIRYYPKAIKAKVVSNNNSNNNFMKLFRYISGDNEDDQKIAMTTPVYMKKNSENSTMEFVMPSKFDMQSISVPNDKSVKIIESNAGYFASVRYGGYSNFSKQEKYTNELMQILKNKDIAHIGDPMVVSYNSPYKFFSRRNEIIIEINYTE
ncbi:MAG: heme-binding protein [Flavobacteriaceae bacterium]|nr:heme-binding protein [Flavobacteriaceae bacterium]